MDVAALCDPLLARFPSIKPWRIGHFLRKIPQGYAETLTGKINLIQDASLAKYYNKLSLITRGDLWSTDRYEAIWKMNTGQYNYLLKKYITLNKLNR